MEAFKKTIESYHNAVIVSAVITNNLIEEIMNSHEYDGIIVSYDAIKEVAIEFAMEHSHVEDWDMYCDMFRHSDWEECVVKYARKKLLKY